MKVLITGAGGFLGRAVVREVTARGHHVIALVRPTTDVEALAWPDHSVTVVRGDLRRPGPWRDELTGAEVTVHLAAATSGDFNDQWAGTVVATEQLLDALDLDALARFVHVSSLAVYDIDSVAPRGRLDETVSLESRPERRDPYTATKLVQEQLVREACAAAGTELVVTRPGAIYGPGKEWGHGAAARVGPVALIVAPNAKLRLVHVDNCAAAIGAAIDHPAAGGRTLNLVDDGLPTHLEYFRRCRRVGLTSGWAAPVPWVMLSALGHVLELVNSVVLRGRARLPELLSLPRLTARWKPLTYPNDAARTALAWEPAVSIEAGVQTLVSQRNRT